MEQLYTLFFKLGKTRFCNINTLTTKTVAGVEIIILTGASHYFKLSNTTVFNNELTLPFSTDLAQQDCRRQRYDQYCPANPGRPAPRGAPVPETHRSTRPTDVWATSRSSRRPDRGDHPAGTNRHGSNSPQRTTPKRSGCQRVEACRLWTFCRQKNRH